MRDSTVAARRTTRAEPARLEMRWMPVIDERGATHMVATWIEPGATLIAKTHHAA